MNIKCGFIGGGNMASSLIGGLLKQSFSADSISVFEPNSERAVFLQQHYGVNIAASNEDIVTHCDVVVIAVKPQVLAEVLKPLASAWQTKKPLLISIVAGIRGDTIEHWLGGQLPIIRVMPNTPALVGAGVSGLFANRQVSEPQRGLAEQLLSAVGRTVWVSSEDDIDTVTALSGSGPAYFMLFIETLINAASEAGLDAKTATLLAVDTAVGAAKLIESSEESPTQLIKNVTSPGGTTEQALNVLRGADIDKTLTSAFAAARLRSQQLAKELADADND